MKHSVFPNTFFVIMKSHLSKLFILLIIIVNFDYGNSRIEIYTKAVTYTKAATDSFLSDTDYFPYETYGETMMKCVYLTTDQREHIVAAERDLLLNYGVSEDYKARQLLELFHSTEELLNQTFKTLTVRLQGELKPNERYDPISDRTFAKIAHCWAEVRRYLEQREEQMDDSPLLLQIAIRAERETSKTYNFMKDQIKKLRERGY